MSARLDGINKWLTLLSNLGVICGFLLLVFQLRQSNETIRLQNVIALQQNTTAAEIAFLNDTTASAWAAVVLQPSDVTPEQLGQVWAYVNAGLGGVLNTWAAREAGYATDADWANARVIAANYLDFAGGRVIWRHTKGTFPAEFAAEIDRELAAGEPNATQNSFLRVLADVRSLPSPEPAAKSSPEQP